MKIENFRIGKLTYTIQADDANGEILESATEENPRTLMFGSNQIMKSFSDGLIGLEEGDAFAFTIAPEKAFGWHSEEKVLEAPLDIFMENGSIREDLLSIGNIIKLQDKNGRPFDGKILEIYDDHVIMDFNHPLADHSLFVKGKVLEVRPATQEELQQEEENRKKRCSRNCSTNSCNSCHE